MLGKNIETMNQLEILENTGKLKDIFLAHKVKKAYFFGSICTEKFTNQSDVDFLIAFDNKLEPIEYGDLYFSLLDSLRGYLKRDIDLITECTLRNPYFIKIINRTKKKIYE